MGLKEYHQKRDFSITKEPKGKVPKVHKRKLAFVVQKHAASRLHYDFRIELDGVMKSWAVPKGPSLDPSDKRLAVQTEDHPIEYNVFEGRIPEGQYGAGTVIVWDRGEWVPEGADPEEQLEKGKIVFSLNGKKLKGRWSLVKMRGAAKEKNQWLLIKGEDNYAKDSSEYSVTDELPKSVLSRVTLEQMALRSERNQSSQR
jgi:bifunctional non-homologous end joining protein LigD